LLLRFSAVKSCFGDLISASLNQPFVIKGVFSDALAAEQAYSVPGASETAAREVKAERKEKT
jgi:hypothetical protein